MTFSAWYDVLIAAILVIATVRGAMKGLVWQLAVIASIVMCFAVAQRASPSIMEHIPAQPPLNRWVAMLVLYVACAFGCFLAARMLHNLIERLKFVEFDRHLGALLGFLKGIVFALVLTFFVVTLSESVRAGVLESRSGYAAAMIMDNLHGVMPEEIHEILEPYIHRLDRAEMDLEHGHSEH